MKAERGFGVLEPEAEAEPEAEVTDLVDIV